VGGEGGEGGGGGGGAAKIKPSARRSNSVIEEPADAQKLLELNWRPVMPSESGGKSDEVKHFSVRHVRRSYNLI